MTTRSVLSIACVIVLSLCGCTRREPDRASNSVPATREPATFVNKVWTVTDSPGGPSGELYVFLSDGTLVIASEEGRPVLGRWSQDGAGLTMVEEALPYKVDILTLNDTEFRIRNHNALGTFELGFAPASQAMADTTRPVEFNPNERWISAHGSNPAWLLTVDGDTAHFRSAATRSLVYTDGSWEQQDSPSWEFYAHRKLPEGGEETLTLTITQSVCVDSTSGAEYPLWARVQRGATRLQGCALAGASQRRPAPAKSGDPNQ